MNKIYQTIIDKKYGNCMQAAYATLFNLKLEEVPHFLEEPQDKWFERLWEFYKSQGYLYDFNIDNHNLLDVLGEKSGFRNQQKNRFDIEVPKRPAINGMFAAIVYSPKYFNIDDKYHSTHQVLIDRKFNIVHDPNPENKGIKAYPLADKIGYNGIKSIEFAVKLSEIKK